MKPVRLNFPAADDAWHHWLIGRSSQPSGVLALVALVFGLTALGFVSWQSWDTQHQLGAVQDAIQAQASKGQGRSLGADQKPMLKPAQRTAWNQIARQLNTPWSGLLDALEAATPDNIALVSIEPDGAQGSVRVQAEAKTLDTLLTYASSLKSIDLFNSVALVKHETNDQDSTRPLRLSLDIRLLNSNTPSSPPAQEVVQ